MGLKGPAQIDGTLRIADLRSPKAKGKELSMRRQLIEVASLLQQTTLTANSESNQTTFGQRKNNCNKVGLSTGRSTEIHNKNIPDVDSLNTKFDKRTERVCSIA